MSAVASLCLIQSQSASLELILKGNIQHHHVQAKCACGQGSWNTPYSSRLNVIKPHTKLPDWCVYLLLPQCWRCGKRGLNFCFVMVIGMLVESSVHNICCLLYRCRGDGEEKGGEEVERGWREIEE